MADTKPYQSNYVGVGGIVKFLIGLLVLIVVTFALMWFFLRVMQDQFAQGDVKSPMGMTKEERLPPEPRLQAAPGFGVGEGKERVNLELKAPQAEYRELQKRWEKAEKEGQKDANGNYITLPVEKAKERFLEEMAKKQPAQSGDKKAETTEKPAESHNAGH